MIERERIVSYLGTDADGAVWATCRVEKLTVDGTWVEDTKDRPHASVLVGFQGRTAQDALALAKVLFEAPRLTSGGTA